MIATGASNEEVVTVTSIKTIISIATEEPVVAVPPIEAIIAIATEEIIPAVVATQAVIAIPSREIVPAVAATQAVITIPSKRLSLPSPPFRRSLPPFPKTVSLPSLLSILSLLDEPWMVSLRLVARPMIEFGPSRSSLRMTPSPEPSATVAPVGADSSRLKVSLFSKNVSSVVWTETVLVVSPAAKFNVPLAAVKSAAVADPSAVA